MNIEYAAYNTAQDFKPGGARNLGELIGVPDLSDQCNPNHRAKLGVADALKMQVVSGDHRILTCMAAELGYMLIRLAPLSGGGAPCAKTMAAVARDFARLMEEVASDLADNTITDNELRRIEKRAGELLVEVQQLLTQLAQMNASTHTRRAA